jgi:hypothetical protein
MDRIIALVLRVPIDEVPSLRHWLKLSHNF